MTEPTANLASGPPRPRNPIGNNGEGGAIVLFGAAMASGVELWVTETARRYALEELARRAGVSSQVFNSWGIEIQPTQTVVYLQPGTRKRICFPVMAPDLWRDICSGIINTRRASWMYPPPEPVRSLVENLVIPFCTKGNGLLEPLFFRASEDCITCSVDLLTSILLSLSRFEETQTADRDEHSRFAASMSIAHRDGFLHRPIVDEYGLALEQVLAALLPGWKPAERKLRVKLSHDIDTVGLPVTISQAVDRFRWRKQPSMFMRDILARFVTAVNPTYLDSVKQLARTSMKRGLDSAVYWMASPVGSYDEGYSLLHPNVRQTIAWLDENNVEMGIHPSYETFRSPQKLASEVDAVVRSVGRDRIGGRQHYLRWFPETWLDWEACGLAYDSTVGFHDHIGFRAGTCFPYHPWSISRNREIDLIEIPLIVADSALIKYMGLTPEASLRVVEDCIARCRLVGGVFTLLWHNTGWADPPYNRLYASLISKLSDVGGFDWRRYPDLY